MVRKLFLFFAVLSLSVAAQAAGIEGRCREILEENFSAMRDEDVSRLLATCSPAAPRRALQTFAAEAADLFAETDVHVSLAGWQWMGRQGAFAAARVRQYTHTDGETDRYRQLSRLLPEHPAVEYVQIFHQHRGRWYIWTSKDERKCQDGNCSLVNN